MLIEDPSQAQDDYDIFHSEALQKIYIDNELLLKLITFNLLIIN